MTAPGDGTDGVSGEPHATIPVRIHQNMEDLEEDGGVQGPARTGAWAENKNYRAR